MDRFLIAPYDKDSGLRTDTRPWLIPDSAFSELTNAYVYRGRVRKRFGSRYINNSQLSSRLRLQVGTVGVPISPVPGFPWDIGTAFSIGTTIFTVYQAVGAMYTTGADTGTFNTATGVFAFVSAQPAGTPIFFYPSLPVMGLLSNEAGAQTNFEPCYAFDTKFAYQYDTPAGGWKRLANETVLGSGAARWTGDNADFFWGTTYIGATNADKYFFVTNFNQSEPNFMRYLINNTLTWSNFRPQITDVDGINPNSEQYLFCARILVPFKNHLLAFNTWEGTLSALGVITLNINYQNRVRWSALGNPTAVNSWRQDMPGQGNGLDAPVVEAIITVEFVKDRLIVFFERSTWELVYQSNQVIPFGWQQINTELGAESTFSIVPFDQVAIGVGNVGIMACNGTNVSRIDNEIPQLVFNFHDTDGGTDRVHGIRDYFVEMIYWTYPDDLRTAASPFPNKVLVYNYKTSTWAINEDSITALGYFQKEAGGEAGVNWDSTLVTWDDPVSWDGSNLQTGFRNVIAGNQQGYTFMINADEATNASVLQITDLVVVGANLITITSIDHNLTINNYVYLEGITGTGNLTDINGRIYKVQTYIDADQFIIIDFGAPIAGVYSGGGVISRVSAPSIKTKEYNFYADKGRNAFINKVDFLVDKTSSGEMQIGFYISTNDSNMIENSLPGVLVGTGTLDTFPYDLYPLEKFSTRLWHPVYFQADGECIQIWITMAEEQIMDPAIRLCDFQMHAMLIHAQPASGNLQ